MPEEVRAKQALVLEKIRKSGKIKIGSNEATKAAERGNAKLIILAEDVSPPEIVMHLPLICRDKNIPLSLVATKQELGKIAGIGVGAAAISVLDEGEAKKDFADLTKKLLELAKK